MEWVVCREESVEKTMEFALVYVADVANLHGVLSTWRRFPQGVSESRICNCKLFAKDVIVSHDITVRVAKMLGHPPVRNIEHVKPRLCK